MTNVKYEPTRVFDRTKEQYTKNELWAVVVRLCNEVDDLKERASKERASNEKNPYPQLPSHVLVVRDSLEEALEDALNAPIEEKEENLNEAAWNEFP